MHYGLLWWSSLWRALLSLAWFLILFFAFFWLLFCRFLDGGLGCFLATCCVSNYVGCPCGGTMC